MTVCSVLGDDQEEFVLFQKDFDKIGWGALLWNKYCLQIAGKV